MGFLRHFVSRWTWQMAWRDTRTSRRRLALYSCSIVLGIAALAAIGSLRTNLEQAIEAETKTLLGADLVLGSQDAFTPEEEDFFKQLGGEQSREAAFTTMMYLPKTQDTRLVSVHALKGEFPFYGELETQPESAANDFRKGGRALVDETVMRQFQAEVGDGINVGKFTGSIVGRLEKVPGETVLLAGIAPSVYISLADLPATELMQPGSLVRYHVFFKFGPGTDVPALMERIRPQLDKFRLGHDTIEERKKELGRAMENFYHFLNLLSLIPLLLGGVGVGSAMHVYIKDKLGTVAVLRCVGSPVSQTFAIYLAQGVALGLLGAMLGGLLGVGAQSLVPTVLADYIPFKFVFHTAWLAIGRAMGIGFVVCLMFALMPLLAVRKVSPLAAIRVAFEPGRDRRDPLRWLLGGFMAAGVVGFAVMQSKNWQTGLGFAIGLGVAFGTFTLLAQLLVLATRKLKLAGSPFVLRQGVANLHRPHNRTLLLLLALGLGTFLLVSLFLVQQMLLKQLITTEGTGQPNAVLFDVQQSQLPGVTNLIRSLNLPVLGDTPVVSMRLSSVKGRSVEAILADQPKHRRDRDEGGGRNWIYRHEYRSTYTDHLSESEKVTAGKWIGHASGETNIPVSLEAGIAKDLKVGLGDELVFDVQGVPVAVRVASLREVEWRRIHPNFFVVFPAGVLESAPTMHVVVTHVASNDESARMQREVVKAFSTVSVIDLTLVLRTVNRIITKISFVVKFSAMFTVLTGLLVVLSALVAGRYQRIRESVLLRTLGASRRQVVSILTVEYAALGLLAAVTGIGMSVVAAWVLAHHVFHMPFTVEPKTLAIALGVVPGVTVVTGFLMSRGVLNQSPLAILRTEV